MHNNAIRVAAGGRGPAVIGGHRRHEFSTHREADMAAYLIVDQLEVTDPDTMK